MRDVEITDALLTIGCQQSKREEDDRIQQVTTANVDRKLSMEAAAQHHKDDSHKTSIDALKMRLFLATAVLWVVWLLVYVILSHWRLI